MKKNRIIYLSNRWLYTLIFLGFIVAITISIYALTPGVKPNPGHLSTEITPPSPCDGGQFLQFDGTNWKCGETKFEQRIVFNAHGDATTTDISSTQADTDMILEVYLHKENIASGQIYRVEIYADANNPPTSLRGIANIGYNGLKFISDSATIAVKKGEYYKCDFVRVGSSGYDSYRVYTLTPIAS